MNKIKLIETVTRGSHIRKTVDPGLILGNEDNGYLMGDILDANATVSASKSLQEQADWNQTDTTKKDYIKNKPDLTSMFAAKQDAPSTAGTDGLIFSLNAQGEPTWIDPIAGSVVDNSMSSVSTNPVQNKVIKEYVDDNVGDTNFIDLTTQSVLSGKVITGNPARWSSSLTVKYLMIPIQEYQGQRLIIKGGIEDGMQLAFLTSLTPGTNDSTPAWAEGEDSIRTVRINLQVNFIVPSDAVCLYYMKESSNGKDRTNGASICAASGLYDKIYDEFVAKGNIIDRLDSSDTNSPLSAKQGNVLNDKIYERTSVTEDLSSRLTLTGCRAASSGGLDITRTTYSSTAYIRVDKGDSISIYGYCDVDNNIAVIALYSTNSLQGYLGALLVGEGAMNKTIQIDDDRVNYIVVSMANSTHPNYIENSFVKLNKRVRIIDNLNSNSSVDALSANQGRVLNNTIIERTEVYDDITEKMTLQGWRNKTTGGYVQDSNYQSTAYIPVRLKDKIHVYCYGGANNSYSIVSAYSDMNISNFIGSLLLANGNVVDTVIEITDPAIKYIIVAFASPENPNYAAGSYAKLGGLVTDIAYENRKYLNSLISDTVRDVPKNITVLNGYKKAKQMLNIEWTPLAGTIPDRFGTNYYTANTKQTGVPYSAVLETHTYVPQDVSFYSFASMVNNPYSLIYTENVAGNHSQSAIGKTYHGTVPTDGQRGTFVGSTCSVLVGYALGFRIIYGASEMYRREDLFVPIYDQSSQGVELMDILVSTGHGILITDIWRTKRGEVVRIKTIEEVGNVIERTFTAEQFDNFIKTNGYKITRYVDLYKNTEYTPSSVVAVTDEGEEPVTPVFNSDICTFKGDRCSFAEGEVIRINFFDGEYTAMEIYKDDVLISTISELDETSHYVDLTNMNLTYGKYKARMVKSDSTYSDYTYWEILECNVSYDKNTYTISVSSSNAVARQAKYVRVTGNIRQAVDAGDISSGDIVLTPKFDVETLTEKVYVIVEFIGDYGGVISEFLDTELY